MIDSESISMSRMVAEYISVNATDADRPLTAPQISSHFHIHPSQVRACVNLSRTMGLPVCSNGKGYFYSTRPEDIQATIAHMEGRIRKQREAINGLKAFMGEVQRNG